MQPEHLQYLMLALACGTIALVVGLVLVPVVRKLAIRIGIVDRPDPTRKLHDGATALGGGFAVFVASLSAIFITLKFLAPSMLADVSPEIPGRWSILLLTGAMIVVLGLLDDWVTLRGRQKLIGQIVIVGVLVGTGTVVREADLFGLTLTLGIFAVPVTMIWLLGAINALNLIDGADGIASTTGSIICGGLAVMAFWRGEIIAGSVAIALAMSLVAFLRYNKPPASIFLGDSGSMLIGLVVGVLAIWTNTKESAAIAAISPIAVLAVPLFDSSIAILRRILTGRSIYAADRAHLHHVLQAYINQRGISQSWLLIVIGILTLIPVSGAVASVIFNQPIIAVVATGIVLGGMVLTKSFGHAELSLLMRRSASFGSSLLARSHRADGMVRHTSVRLQGARDWDQAWTTLTDFADRHDLWQVKLDLNVAWLHEGFHGDWQRGRLPERAVQWSLRLPVEVADRQVGNLHIIGRGGGSETYQLVETLVEMLRDLEPNFERLVSEDPRIARVPESAPVARESAERSAADRVPVQSVTAS